ncbi:MAG TPA: hypothetical protein VGD81_15125 [Opitutaceae bacterium]
MIALAGLCLAAAPAHAYIGPGGGMSAIGALLALVAGVLVAFFGFLWYPIKRFRAKRRRQPPENAAPPQGRVNPPQ